MGARRSLELEVEAVGDRFGEDHALALAVRDQWARAFQLVCGTGQQPAAAWVATADEGGGAASGGGEMSAATDVPGGALLDDGAVDGASEGGLSDESNELGQHLLASVS